MWSGGIFITTSVITQNEKKNTEMVHGGWTVVSSEEKFVAGIEEFQIKLRHRFHASHKGGPLMVNGDSAMGFLQPADLSKPPLRIDFSDRACDINKKQGTFDCDAQMPQWERISPHKCGAQVSASNRTCMSSVEGDYISIGVLLEAAGISLDEPSAAEENRSLKRTLRHDGVIVQLGVAFTNMDPHDFWTFPIGASCKYTLYPNRAVYSGQDDSLNTRVTYSADGTHRVKTTSRGITLALDSDGTLGIMSFAHILTTIVVSTAVLAYGHLIVNYGLTEIYMRIPSRKHVGLLHALSVYEFTPTEEEMYERGVDGRGDDIKAFRELSHAAVEEQLDTYSKELSDTE
jgi:hypothetical protein